MSILNKEHVNLIALCSITALSVLLLDRFTPLGIAEPILYVVVVYIALQSRSAKFIYIVASSCTLLTAFGYFFSPITEEIWKAIVNRLLAVLVIWITAMIGVHRQTLLIERQKLLSEREDLLSRALLRFITICSWCNNVRMEDDTWKTLEDYVSSKTVKPLNHGICPECAKDVTRKFKFARKDTSKQTVSATKDNPEPE